MLRLAYCRHLDSRLRLPTRPSNKKLVFTSCFLQATSGASHPTCVRKVAPVLNRRIQTYATVKINNKTFLKSKLHVISLTLYSPLPHKNQAPEIESNVRSAGN